MHILSISSAQRQAHVLTRRRKVHDASTKGGRESRERRDGEIIGSENKLAKFCAGLPVAVLLYHSVVSCVRSGDFT